MSELTVLSSRNCRTIATFLNFYVSHGSATRFLRKGKKYYVHFIDNLLLFPTVREFSKSVNTVYEVIPKNSTPHFFPRHSVVFYFVTCNHVCNKNAGKNVEPLQSLQL